MKREIKIKMYVMFFRKWSFSNFKNARPLENKWLQGHEYTVYGTVLLSGLLPRLSLGTQGETTQTDCQMPGSRAWQLPCSNAEIPKSYELLAFPSDIHCGSSWSHLGVKWILWAKSLAKSRPSALHPWCLYLKQVDARLPLDFQWSKSLEDPPNFGQPRSDQTSCPLSRPYWSSPPSPFV